TTAPAPELTGQSLAAAPTDLGEEGEHRPRLIESGDESSPVGTAAKRLLALTFAGLLRLVLSPLMLLLALAIVLDSRGPVFYRCRRVGQGAREFAMLKFRKMYDGARGLPLTV